MTEYYTVKRIDNSRLIRPMAPARLKDYWRRVGVGAAMAACLLIYTWQHFECIRLRYEVQKLQAIGHAEKLELFERPHHFRGAESELGTVAARGFPAA